MKLHSHRILAISTFIMLLSIGAFTAILYIFPSSDITTSALTYQTDSTMSFTFSPMISINVSSNTIDIPTLAPSTTAESDPITVTVATNTAYGYSLYADVGSNDTQSTYYNTSDLTHTDTNTGTDTTSTNASFTSISTNASLPSLTTDNTWGYSTSNDNGTTWSTYNGLPTATSTESSTSTSNPALLIDTKDPGDSSRSIDFKIAARSSATQPSGTYSNVINFYAVGKPEVFYMQDTTAIKSKLKNTGDELQAIDTRDGKEYWVAMQADGNIWMTQNLDLCIGCDGTSTLTSQNTDLNTSIYPYGSENGYSEVDGIITWTPNYTAITSRHVITDATVSPAFPSGNSQNRNPYSAEGGDIYIYTSDSAENDIIYTSIDQCVSAVQSASKCTHYHVGNYYNWSAAAAFNGSAGDVANLAANSICPSGWRLPVAQETSTPTAKTSEFGWLFQTSGITQYIFISSYTDDGFNLVRNSPIYFVRGGYIDNSSLKQRTDAGQYWSSIGDTKGLHARRAGFDSKGAYVNTSNYRPYGYSIRCLVRQ